MIKMSSPTSDRGTSFTRWSGHPLNRIYERFRKATYRMGKPIYDLYRLGQYDGYIKALRDLDREYREGKIILYRYR